MTRLRLRQTTTARIPIRIATPVEMITVLFYYRRGRSAPPLHPGAAFPTLPRRRGPRPARRSVRRSRPRRRAVGRAPRGPRERHVGAGAKPAGRGGQGARDSVHHWAARYVLPLLGRSGRRHRGPGNIELDQLLGEAGRDDRHRQVCDVVVGRATSHSRTMFPTSLGRPWSPPCPNRTRPGKGLSPAPPRRVSRQPGPPRVTPWADIELFTDGTVEHAGGRPSEEDLGVQ
jgi:hypothetical protein